MRVPLTCDTKPCQAAAGGAPSDVPKRASHPQQQVLPACSRHQRSPAAPHRLQESVEPIMEQYKPPGLIKKMYFKHLTFGDAPFKIENVWVEEHSKDHVLMEVAPAGSHGAAHVLQRGKVDVVGSLAARTLSAGACAGC